MQRCARLASVARALARAGNLRMALRSLSWGKRRQSASDASEPGPSGAAAADAPSTPERNSSVGSPSSSTPHSRGRQSPSRASPFERARDMSRQLSFGRRRDSGSPSQGIRRADPATPPWPAAAKAEPAAAAAAAGSAFAAAGHGGVAGSARRMPCEGDPLSRRRPKESCRLMSRARSKGDAREGDWRPRECGVLLLGLPTEELRSGVDGASAAAAPDGPGSLASEADCRRLPHERDRSAMRKLPARASARATDASRAHLCTSQGAPGSERAAALKRRKIANVGPPPRCPRLRGRGRPRPTC